MILKKVIVVVLCFSALAHADWPEPGFAEGAQKGIDVYIHASNEVQRQTKYLAKDKAPALKKAVRALEDMQRSAEDLVLQLNALKAIAHCKGTLHKNRVVRWLRTIKLPSENMFIQRVQSSDQPLYYKTAAIMILERAPLTGHDAQVAREAITTLKARKKLPEEQKALVVREYGAWYRPIDETLQKKPLLADLELIAMLTQQKAEVLSLFKTAESGAFVMNAYTQRKDQKVPSKKAQELFKSLVQVTLFKDAVRNGRELARSAHEALQRLEA